MAETDKLLDYHKYPIPPNHEEYLGLLRELVIRRIELRYSANIQQDAWCRAVVSAVDELVSNVMGHDSKGGLFELKLYVPKVIVCTRLYDCNIDFDELLLKYKSRHEQEINSGIPFPSMRGRGLVLINSMMDSITGYQDGIDYVIEAIKNIPQVKNIQ